MEKAFWPTGEEILKVQPRPITQEDENQFNQPQDIEMVAYLPEEIIRHEQRLAPSERQAIIEQELA